MPSRRMAKWLWTGPPSRALLTQQCPSGPWNPSENQPPSMPAAPGPHTPPGLCFTGPTCFTCAQLQTWLLLNACALPRQPFPHAPGSSEQVRNSKFRRIPSGGLLDKTEKQEIQPVQGLRTCIFLVQYQMELRKPNHLLIFVCVKNQRSRAHFSSVGCLWSAGGISALQGPTQKVSFDLSL